jgi:lysophospholipase L1-like esterase
MTTSPITGRLRPALLALALLGFSSAVFDAEPGNAPGDAAIKPIRAHKIVLIGDSTMAVQSGWGGSFCDEHVTSFVACVNLARPGRSSGSYIAEGSWELALAEAQAPGFVSTWMLIQFGHNDQPGKPGRSTDLATEFPANLRRYVSEARSAGAKPILVTPLTRRMFKDGRLQNSLEPWAKATIEVAAEMKVPLIDLNARSSAAVQAMGPGAANELAEVPPSPEVAAAAARGDSAFTSSAETAPQRKSFDFTHLGRKGADYFSSMVTEELVQKVPEMRTLLIP